MLATLRTHLRLLLRTPGFWAVALGSSVAMGLLSFGNLLPRTFELSDALLIPLVFLAQLLLTIAGAQQERAERVEELLEALPYPLPRYLAGRFLAAYLPWLAVSLLVWLAMGVGALAGGNPVDWWLLARHWALAAPVTLLCSTSMGLVIGQFLRQGLLAYLTGTILWLLFPFLPVLLSQGDGRALPPLLEIAASTRYFPFSDLGFLSGLPLLLLNRLYVLALALLLGALLLIARARRRQLQTGAAAVALLVCGAIALGSGGTMTWLWQSRQAGYDAALAALPHDDGRVRSPATPPDPVATADNYQIHLTLDPAAHRLQATGSWTLRNPSNQTMAAPRLSLQRALTVERLTTASGEAVPFTRDGDWLILSRPLAAGEELALTGAWSGTVWEWRQKDGLKLGAHISERSILLPANWGWYPTAGDAPLAFTRDVCTGSATNCQPRLNHRGPVPPASFALSVTGSTLNLIHNAGPKAPGLYLIGTPYPLRQFGSVAMAVSPLTAPRAAALAASYEAQIGALQAIVPRALAPLRIVEVSPEVYWTGPWDETGGTFPEALLLSGSAMGIRTDSGTTIDTATYQIARSWWPEGPNPAVRYLRQELLAYMYQRQADRHDVRTGSGPLRQILEAVESKQGEEAALALLRALHARQAEGGPTYRDLVTLLAPLGDDPQIKAALQQLPPWVTQS